MRDVFIGRSLGDDSSYILNSEAWEVICFGDQNEVSQSRMSHDCGQELK